MVTALHWSDFEIGGELGAGRAGVVLRARLRRSVGHLEQGLSVALKRYKSWVIDEPGQLERIFRELETGRKVTHKNLVNTLGIVTDDLGRPALVMKYYEGESLQKLLDRHRGNCEAIDCDLALTILEGLAGALGALHTNGIVHRDVKPANVLLMAEGPVLMDLGVVTSHDFAQMTTTPEFLGTIRYAAPEYLFGRSYDLRADLFSFGTIAYELLMGDQFDSDTQHWAELVAKRMFDYRFSWNMDQRAALTKRIGLNRLELFVGILESTLIEPDKRNLNLASLELAIRERWFEQQFHFDQGRCTPYAPLFYPLGDFTEGPGTLPVGDVVEDIRRKLAPAELESLRTALKEHYWDWYPSDPVKIEGFVEAGVVTTGPVGWLEIHPAIRYAYRYGIL
jgi:serine/threonine protein kinase